MAQAPASPMPAGASSPFAPPPAGVNPFFPFFTPSFDLALAGSVAISAVAVVHLFLVFKTKAKYLALLAKAALFFGAGMALRLVVIVQPSATPSLVSTFLLQIPGTLVAISLIFTYTRMMWWVTPDEHRNFTTLWTPPRATSICIALAQSICDTIGTLGSGIIPSPGKRTLAIGAVLELLVWMFFAMLVIRFTFMSQKWNLSPDIDRERVWHFGLALSASSVLLVIRGGMQVLEKDATQALISTGKPGSIVTTEEWVTWVFDFLPNFLILAIMAAYHPGYYLPKRLTGFRLKTKELVKEKERSPTSNGWVISTPFPIRDEKDQIRIAEEEIGSMGYAR